MKNKAVSTEANQHNTQKLVNQLNDIHDGLNEIRKITSFLGSATIYATESLCDDDVEGAELCFRMLNENILSKLDNLDNLITEVKSL